MYSRIEKYASSISSEITSHRRALHRIPETAFNEHKTHAYILSALKDIHSEFDSGMKIYVGAAVTGHDTGIIAELFCGPGPVIALRFDIDALAVSEPENDGHLPFSEGFSSLHPGFMHACGHDGHAAIGLACVKICSAFKNSFRGTLRFIFQPAEEGCRGARTIVEMGRLDDADVLLSGHIVGRDYDPSGSCDIIPGVISSLATTKLNVTFKGKSCHASEPENGINVLPAIAFAVMKFTDIPVPKEGRALLNVGRITAGEGRNIIAGSGFLEMETRGSSTELNRYMEQQAVEIIRMCADEYGCRADIDILGSSPCVESSPELCSLSKKLCRLYFSEINSAEAPAVFKASEDVSVMLEHVKAHGGKGIFALFTTDTAAPLHSCFYDFDETILPKASAFLSGLCLALSAGTDFPF